MNMQLHLSWMRRLLQRLIARSLSAKGTTLMRLYYSPAACSMAAHITAREAGLPVSLVRVDLRTHRTEDGSDYYKINPKGYVPALELPDGAVLTEVAAIVQYLADQAPQSGLAPAAGTLERYRLQEWLTFISSELHKAMGPLFYPNTTAEAKTAIKEKLAVRFAFIEKALAGRDYLTGQTFTAADAYAFTILNWTGMLGVDVQPYPQIRAYMDRVGSRSKVREVIRAEGVLKEAAAA
jgi:glutathione S-transferase